MRRSSLASLLTVAFVVQIIRIHSPGAWVILWGAAYALWFAGQELLLHAYRRAAPADADITRWRRAVIVMLALSGAIWGVGLACFVMADDPLTTGLLVCAMAAITSGSIGFRSTILTGFYMFNLLVAVPMGVRLLTLGEWAYDLLGVSVLIYVLVVIGYGRAQHALISDNLRLRFGSDALAEALREQTQAAERARRDAEQASLAKSQFLAAASHDLRQPLYALSLFSGSLRALELDATAGSIVNDVQDSIAAMEALFTGLLDISRLEAGAIEPALGPVSVDLIFDRLSQYFRPIAIERGVELRLRSDGEWVQSDPVLLEQVLSNLVANALRWTRHGGALVAARRRGDGIVLEVWDTGIGIASVDQTRIFEEFVQLGNVERDRRKGLGLGLAIARRSAALLGTQIVLKSRLGAGSRFSIVQPAAPRPATSSPGLPAADRRLPAIARDKRLPVLVIEDDLSVRNALGDLLRRWGIDVMAFEQPDAALAAIGSGCAFGLVISDYRLRAGQSGIDLLERIADIHPAPAPPSLLITGDTDVEIAMAARRRGVPLLLKPVRSDDLAKILGVT